MPPTDSVHGPDAKTHNLPSSDNLFAAAYDNAGRSLSNFGSAFTHGYDSLNNFGLGVQMKELEIGRGIDHAIGQGVSAVGREMSAENPEVPAAGNAIAGAYNRVNDFYATRPMTAAAESVLPGLSIVDGLARGGVPQHHDAPPPPSTPAATEAQTGHAPSPEHPVTEAQDRNSTHPVTEAQTDRNSTHPVTEAQTDRNSTHHVTEAQTGHAANHTHGRTHGHVAEPPVTVNSAGHKETAAQHGDGYWAVARRFLGHTSSNRDVAALAVKLSTQNGNKVLQPGDKLTYLST